MYLWFWEIVIVMINWWQDFSSSNSVCNHTYDWQIGLPFWSCPILLITYKYDNRLNWNPLCSITIITSPIPRRQLTEYQSIVDRHSVMVDIQSIVRYLTDVTLNNRSTIGRYIGRESADTRTMHRSRWMSMSIRNVTVSLFARLPTLVLLAARSFVIRMSRLHLRSYANLFCVLFHGFSSKRKTARSLASHRNIFFHRMITINWWRHRLKRKPLNC